MCSACHATRSHLSFTPPFTPQNRRQTLGTSGSLRTDRHNVRAFQHIKIYHSHYHSHHQRRRQKHPAVAGTGEHGSVREHNAHMCDKQTRLTRKTERKKIRFTLSFTPSAQHSGGGRSNSHRQSQMDEVGVRPCVCTHMRRMKSSQCYSHQRTAHQWARSQWQHVVVLDLAALAAHLDA